MKQHFDNWIVEQLAALREELTVMTRDDTLFDEVDPSWTSRTAQAVVVQNDTKLDPLENPPGIHRTLTFLLPQPRFIVHSGDRVLYEGHTFDIAQVKECRDLDGNVAAYRCESIR